jgi:phytol kinase
MDEISRKVVHVLFGLGIAGFILIIGKQTAIATLALAIFVGFVISDTISRGYHIPLISGIVEALERKDELPGRGALFFVISALICLILFDLPFVIPAIVTLAVLDGVATIAGMKFGRIRLCHGKSLEGSIAGFGAAALVLLFWIPPFTVLAVALTGAIVELCSPFDDNLLIPVSICVLLTLVPGFPV